MSAWIADAGAALLQAAATLPDTIVTKQVQTDPGWFSKFTSIASGLMTIALLVLTAFLVPAAWRFRHTHKKASELLDRVYGDINPIMRHASVIADNVDYITTSMRVDVQQLRQTLATANDQLLRAAKLSERRLHELNALLDVVQEEAEDVFVSTASTIRGVRAGAERFRDEATGRRQLAPAADAVDEEGAGLDAALAGELDAALTAGMDETFEAGFGEALDEAFDADDEVNDGHDAAYPADGRDEQKPRIRRRGSRHA